MRLHLYIVPVKNQQSDVSGATGGKQVLVGWKKVINNNIINDVNINCSILVITKAITSCMSMLQQTHYAMREWRLRGPS